MVALEEGSFKIEFTGSFCHACGFYDYFDDYKVILEENFRLKTKINEIEEIEEGTVEFKITK